jgi:hypothetical protein
MSDSIDLTVRAADEIPNAALVFEVNLFGPMQETEDAAKFLVELSDKLHACIAEITAWLEEPINVSN